MTTYNTGNPVPSTDVRDLYDNAENLDNLVNGPAVEYDDRLGVPRKSWRGMEVDFANFLASSGFENPPLVYVDGVPLQVDRPTQLIQRGDFIYSVELPASFPVNLSGTWATDEPLLVVRINRNTIDQVPTVAVLRTIAGRYDGDVCYVVGYQTAAPGVGGGLMRWDSALTAADNSGTIFAVSGVATGRWVRADQSHVTIEDFGAYEGQLVAPCTAAILNAITVRAGAPLYIPARRYLFEGISTAQKICLIGEKCPEVSDSKGALENGSTLVGSAFFQPIDGYFANFGVDHGVDTFPSTGADGLKISTDLPNTGRSLKVDNVVGLGRAAPDLFHAVLIEGYARAFVTRVTGVRNYYGLAIKCVRTFVDDVYAEDNGLYGVIAKSDSTSGSLSQMHLNNIICNGTAGVTQIALQIESSDANLSALKVNGVIAQGVASIVRVAGGVIAQEVTLDNLYGRNLTGDAIRQTGLAYTLRISNVDLAQCSARAAIFADVRHLTINGLTAVAVPGGGANFATDFISIAAPCIRTNLSGINLNADYSSAAGGEGMINYLNTRGQNIIADGFYATTGTGAPVTQVVTVSVDPAGTTTRQTYKVRAIKAAWAGAVARQFNLSNDNTPDGHSVRVENTTGQNLTVANAAGSSLTVLATNRWGEFVKAGANFVAVATGTI